MPCITVEAELSNIPKVTAFIDAQLEELCCPFKSQMKIDVVIDELFSNIARYAYPNGKGDVKIETAYNKADRTFSIAFIDGGTPYNPLKKDDPDISLSAEEREVGGLGIFMVKNMVDEITYNYKCNKNILTVIKNI